MKLYVASSWRNEYQPAVVLDLRDCDHDVYDFRNPNSGDTGFHWSDIDQKWETWTPKQFIEGLSHDVAIQGFKSDAEAMDWADACVLVLPCGRSAHLEAGWFVGENKPLFILISPDVENEPELMYLMAGDPRKQIHDSMGSLLDALGMPWNERKQLGDLAGANWLE